MGPLSAIHPHGATVGRNRAIHPVAFLPGEPFVGDPRGYGGPKRPKSRHNLWNPGNVDFQVGPNPYKAAPEAMEALVALENYVQERGGSTTR
jgi:hypothetical protein